MRKVIQHVCDYRGVKIERMEQPAKALKGYPSFREKILNECGAVQCSVWNPKQSIRENTIDNDLLYLISFEGKYVGFASVEFAMNENMRVAHWHDVMILGAFQGRGLSRLVALCLVTDIAKNFLDPKYYFLTVTTNKKYLNMFCSKPDIFKMLSFPLFEGVHREVIKNVMPCFFPGERIDLETGIMRDVQLLNRSGGQYLERLTFFSTVAQKRISIPLEPYDSFVVISEIDEESAMYANDYLKNILNVEPNL